MQHTISFYQAKWFFVNFKVNHGQNFKSGWKIENRFRYIFLSIFYKIWRLTMGKISPVNKHENRVLSIFDKMSRLTIGKITSFHKTLKIELIFLAYYGQSFISFHKKLKIDLGHLNIRQRAKTWANIFFTERLKTLLVSSSADEWFRQQILVTSKAQQWLIKKGSE